MKEDHFDRSSLNRSSRYAGHHPANCSLGQEFAGRHPANVFLELRVCWTSSGKCVP